MVSAAGAFHKSLILELGLGDSPVCGKERRLCYRADKQFLFSSVCSEVVGYRTGTSGRSMNDDVVGIPSKLWSSQRDPGQLLYFKTV